MEKFILAIDPGAKTGIVVFDTASGTMTAYPACDARDGGSSYAK